MGLDKWIKPQEQEKKTEKKSKNQKSKLPKDIKQPKTPIQVSKYILTCTKCKYQKILRKKELVENDKICPKCKSKMKIK